VTSSCLARQARLMGGPHGLAVCFRICQLDWFDLTFHLLFLKNKDFENQKVVDSCLAFGCARGFAIDRRQRRLAFAASYSTNRIISAPKC